MRQPWITAAFLLITMTELSMVVGAAAAQGPSGTLTTVYNIKTSERYLHVSKKQLVNIISPLDDLWNKGKIDW